MNRKAFTVRLPPELVKELRIKCIKEGRRVNEIIEELVSGYVFPIGTIKSKED